MNLKLLNRLVTRLLIAVGCIGGSTVSLWAEPAAGTPSGTSGDRTVEVSETQLLDIQRELEYLRARDAERQAWEASVIDRLPDAPFEFASHRRTQVSQSIVDCDITSSCGVSGTSCSTCCNSCSCYPCQCPLPPAPCIDCPHVSTLSPYFNVNVFGAIKLDMLFNTARPVAAGVPFYLAPASAFNFNENTVDIHARQTTLGAAFTGPQVGGFQTGGSFLAMLFDGSVIADQYGFLPLQAYGEMKNDTWRFAAGLQFDVFAPGVPTVLPFSALGGSGNAGNSFRGQIRMERYFYPSSTSQWTVQFALSEPITTTINPTFLLEEDNGWPNVEGRIAWGRGPRNATTALRPFEVGVSGVVGQVRQTQVAANQIVNDVWGLSGDFRWNVNSYFGFMGEFYTGQGLGTYNGGILQIVDPINLNAIRTTGGWLETFVYLTPCLHTHIGYGIDDPLNRDLSADPTSRGIDQNTTFYSNLLWDLNKTFRVGFEFTYRETQYRNPLLLDNEGAGFHTQLQWSF